MAETEMILPTEGAHTPPLQAQTPTDVMQAMQSQASGMIALDVEGFSNGFMQIMLAGIGWASAEIASTEGTDGEDELTFFTTKLSTDLPLIIQNIVAASKGDYVPPPAPAAPPAPRQLKKSLFSK